MDLERVREGVNRLSRPQLRVCCSSPGTAARTRRSRRAFHLSPHTIKSHLATIMQRLGVHTRSALVAAAWRSGLMAQALKIGAVAA